MPNWLANDQDSTILVYLASSEDLHPNSCTNFRDLCLFSSLFLWFIKLYIHRNNRR